MNGNGFRAELARQLRVDSIRCSAAAGSGHPTSSMSAADLMAVLVDGYLARDSRDPTSRNGDHLIFSKGHASPLYYAVLKAIGVIGDEELLSFRRFGSRLEGHPTPRLPATDVATGSLGQGLPIAVGVALAGQRLDRLPYRVWVLCGDSEMAEGSIWEAFACAAWEGLDNLTAIVDVNRLGQTRQTRLGWDMEAYAERASAFGWYPIVVDGHDLDAIDGAYTAACAPRGMPTAILARTEKGHGVKSVANRPGFHGKPLDDPEAAIEELGGQRDLPVRTHPARSQHRPHRFPVAPNPGEPPSWQAGEMVPTRLAYGQALSWLGGVRPEVVALDAEVSNSTYSELFAKAHPERYFEMFIAEQQMVATAVGMQVQGWIPYASTFGAFLARAYDFVRMGAVSGANICLVGSHAGVAIGEDGPSQMALEDMASLRAVHGSTVLHPSDANQTVQLVAAMADLPGIRYLRTLRGATSVLTGSDEQIRVGGSRTVVEPDQAARTDQSGSGHSGSGHSGSGQAGSGQAGSGQRRSGMVITVVACGVTVAEAVRAAQELAAAGVPVRVLDCYSIKPIDVAALTTAAEDSRTFVTVEDHWPEGGLGDAVGEVLAVLPEPPRVIKLAVRQMPGSGTPAELLHAAGIDAAGIVAAVRRAWPVD